jgi:hypothetical protein
LDQAGAQHSLSPMGAEDGAVIGLPYTDWAGSWLRQIETVPGLAPSRRALPKGFKARSLVVANLKL